MATVAVPQTPEESAAELQAIAQQLTTGVDLSLALERCADVVLDGIDEHFRSKKGPSGETWPPHAPSTVARYGPHPLLVLSGDLRTGAIHGNIRRITDDTLEIGVSKDTFIYAGVQQHGWPEKNIPPRPYIGASDEVVNKCGEIISEAFASVFNG